MSPRNPPGPLLAAQECCAWPQAKSCLRDSASCTPTGFSGPQFPHMQSGFQFLAPRAAGCSARVPGCRLSHRTAGAHLSTEPQHEVRWPEDSERVGGAVLLIPECWGTERFPFSQRLVFGLQGEHWGAALTTHPPPPENLPLELIGDSLVPVPGHCAPSLSHPAPRFPHFTRALTGEGADRGRHCPCRTVHCRDRHSPCQAQ